MHKVMITLPEDLLEMTDQMAQKLAQKRSEFIRVALVERLTALRRQEFEALLAEGYQEMAEQNAQAGGQATVVQAMAVNGWVWDEE